MQIGLGLGLAPRNAAGAIAPPQEAWTLDDIPAAQRVGLWDASRARVAGAEVLALPDVWGGVEMAAGGARPALVQRGGRAAAVWPDRANDVALTPTAAIAPAWWMFVADFRGGAAATWPANTYPNLLSTGGNGSSAFGRRVMGAANGTGLFQNEVWTGRASVDAGAASATILPLPMSMVEISGPAVGALWSIGLSSGASGRGWQGAVWMALALNAAPAGDLLARIQGRVAWDYGLQARLPATHPFRNAAPLK